MISWAAVVVMCLGGVETAAAQVACAFPDVCLTTSIPSAARRALLDQPWAAAELAPFLKTAGEVRYVDARERPVRLTPRYDVWRREGGQRVATRTGKPIDLTPGNHRLASLLNGIFDVLPGQLEAAAVEAATTGATPRQFVVTAVQTVQGGPSAVVRNPQVFVRGATLAIAFYFTPAEPTMTAAQAARYTDQVFVVSVALK
jgi:hypothetical protein